MFLSRHLDRLSDLGDIPTEVFIDLLKRAKEKATPELVKRFQDINEVREQAETAAAHGSTYSSGTPGRDGRDGRG